MFEGKDVVASMGGFPDGAYSYETEYSGAYCKCGTNLYIKTPQEKDWYPIKCPLCGFVVNLYCGKE